MSILKIPEQHLAHLDETALRVYPEECCGALLGIAGVVRSVWPATNVYDGPKSKRYTIDPEELLKAHKSAREAGCEVIGYYHSHPDQAATPSKTDLAAAVWDVSYLILSVTCKRVEERRAWRLSVDTKGFVEEQIR